MTRESSELKKEVIALPEPSGASMLSFKRYIKTGSHLRTRLRDLKNQAEAIRLRANELHGSLINELESAGAVRAG